MTRVYYGIFIFIAFSYVVFTLSHHYNHSHIFWPANVNHHAIIFVFTLFISL